LKQEFTPIEASNIAGLGSDLEKEIKAAAAECEHAWDGVGSQTMLRVWRIEKFKVVEWPAAKLGSFFDGDSYVLLHSYHKSNDDPAIHHDAHFWIGKDSSQDEYGTAAYKTVELDDKLGGQAVQHREVQGHESDLFLSYFPGRTIEILSGGVDSGFNHVEPEKYVPRLLHVKGTRKHIRVTQVEMNSSSLNAGDCFVLDAGLKIIQWNGEKVSLFEKMKAGRLCRAIRDERKGKPEAFIIDQNDDDDEVMEEFWRHLGGKGAIKSAEEGGSDTDAAAEASAAVKLYRLHDEGGKCSFTLEKAGPLAKSDLDSSDVFVLDNGAEVFTWIGKGSSKIERKQGMHYAQQYLVDNGLDPNRPISRVLEGGENEVFNENFEGGYRSRGVDMFDESANALPPCCPHTPESDKWASMKQDPAHVDNIIRNRGGGADNEQIAKAATQVFGFFSNHAKKKGWF